jgi:hypothetical protein
MQDKHTSTAGDDKTSVENLSFEEMISRRLGENVEPESTEETIEEESTEEAEPEPEEVVEEAETEEEPEEDSEEEEESTSDIDLLDLSPEQIKELAKKGKSRLLERIGELTAKNKALEEKAKQFDSQQTTREIPQEQNPFANLNTQEELAAKYKEFEQTLETTDQILEEHEDYGPDDIISVGDKEFTKRQIRKANRNAREAITKYLPAQHQHLAKLNHYQTMGEQYKAAAEKEVPEIKDEKSEIAKNYKALVSDPLIERVKKEIPELGMQVEYILAHAAKSIFGRKAQIATGAGKRLKAEPPASPVGAGVAASSKNSKVKVKEAYTRFEQTGNVDDWVAARIAQMR